MSRTFHEMSHEERQAYRIWESYLNDRTRSQKEHELARQKMDELLWAGPNAQVVELKCRIETLEAAVADARTQLNFLASAFTTVAEFVQMISAPKCSPDCCDAPATAVPCPECGTALPVDGPIPGFDTLGFYVSQPDEELTDAARPEVCPCHETTNPFALAADRAVEHHAVPAAPDVPQVTNFEEGSTVDPETVPARRRGRPKGSKNKPKPAPAPEVLDFSPPPVEFLPAVAEPAPPVDAPQVTETLTDPLADLFL